MKVIQCSKHSLKLVKHSDYRGYLVAEELKCDNCQNKFLLSVANKKKFESKVDTFLNYPFHTKTETKNEKSIRFEEIQAQHVLMKSLIDFQIISMDHAGVNNQYDLLALKNGYSIAVEITQTIDEDKFNKIMYLSKNSANLLYPIDRSNCYWIIALEISSDFSSENLNNFKKILLELEKKYNINTQAPLPESIENELIKSAKDISIYIKPRQWTVGATETSQRGSLKIILDEASLLNPNEFFSLINNEANKYDNLCKLRLANTNERHLFIVIPPYEHSKAYCLKHLDWLLKCKFSKNAPLKIEHQEILSILNNFNIPNDINVVWVAQLGGFDDTNTMRYRLVKMKNHKVYYEITILNDDLII